MKRTASNLVALNLGNDGTVRGKTLEEMLGFPLEAIMPVSYDDAVNTIAGHVNSLGRKGAMVA